MAGVVSFVSIRRTIYHFVYWVLRKRSAHFLTVENFSKSYFRKCSNFSKSTTPEISEVIILRKNARIFFVAPIINKYTLTVKRDRPYQTESQSFGEANR